MEMISFGSIFSIIYLVLTLSIIIVIVMDNRNPVRTLAWILVLLFLPLLGLILYFAFGQNIRRKRRLSQFVPGLINPEILHQLMEAEPAKIKPEQATKLQLFENVSDALPLDASHCEIFTVGDDMLQSLLSAMENATNHIHVQFYIFEEDAIGNIVKDVLIKKAREGVKVRVIYDHVGCWSVKHEFYEEMEREGVEIYPFRKVYFPFFTSRVNFRNHRKIVVIDGRIGFVGGMNLALRYFRKDKGQFWRDTHLRLEGRAVYGLQYTFLSDWMFVSQQQVRSVNFFPELPANNGLLCQIVHSEPSNTWENIMMGFMQLILQAKQYCYIQTPYFLPTDCMLKAMQTAALSGVDVRLMIPGHSDSILPHLGSQSYLEDVLRAGVRVYVYKEDFLHAKTLVCDDEVATVGSTNMDFRSFEHNFEVNAFIYNSDFAKRSREIYVNDMQTCYELTLEKWEKRSVWKRITESFVRLLSPLL